MPCQQKPANEQSSSALEKVQSQRRSGGRAEWGGPQLATPAPASTTRAPSSPLSARVVSTLTATQALEDTPDGQRHQGKDSDRRREAREALACDRTQRPRRQYSCLERRPQACLAAKFGAPLCSSKPTTTSSVELLASCHSELFGACVAKQGLGQCGASACWSDRQAFGVHRSVPLGRCTAAMSKPVFGSAFAEDGH